MIRLRSLRAVSRRPSTSLPPGYRLLGHGPWLTDLRPRTVAGTLALGGFVSTLASLLISNCPNAIPGWWYFFALMSTLVGVVSTGCWILEQCHVALTQVCPQHLLPMPRGATQCPYCHPAPEARICDE